MLHCLKITKSEHMLIMYFSAFCRIAKECRVGMCSDSILKTTPNLLKFYFYYLDQGWLSLVNQDNMTIESCVIGHMTYCYIKIYSKISWWFVTLYCIHLSVLPALASIIHLSFLPLALPVLYFISNFI